jgi:hypothetical protein
MYTRVFLGDSNNKRQDALQAPPAHPATPFDSDGNTDACNTLEMADVPRRKVDFKAIDKEFEAQD